MAIIVSTSETIVPVSKKQLFDYVRFQTRMSNPDFLSDTDLCQMASVIEQNEARARKFITKQVTIAWEVGDSDAELPSDFYEVITYKRGSGKVDIPVVTTIDFGGYVTSTTESIVNIRYDGVSQKVYIPSSATDSFNDYITYVAVPNVTDPAAWTPSFGQTWFPLMSAAVIKEVMQWIYLNPSSQISDITRSLAREALPLWEDKYRKASKGVTPRTTVNNNFRGSY